MSLDALITLLCLVESGGDPRAVGDGGRAIGILQIHRAAWKEGCGFLGVSWPYPDGAYSVEKSRAICKAYLLHYGGPDAGPERWARIWNGGPRGDRRRSTLVYWHRVRRCLKAHGQ